MCGVDSIQFEKLFHLGSDAFWEPYRCKINESGIVPYPIDNIDSNLFLGDEWLVFLEARRDLILQFPCSREDLVKWAERNGFADVLPDDFLETTNENAVVDNKSIEQLNEIDQAKPIEAIAGPGRCSRFEHEETKAWKAKALEIGESWMTKERTAGKDPGIVEIAKYVEGELSNLNITGKRGKFLDWETIKREALKGITGKPAN